ncbi:beta-1,3-galactosyltransferase 4 [Ictidomys tridecemlineatus]|uniref:beta-1,3-galactosyltransferase 4 n=1 Tax=Ictidomys tridecemlineatus TaxID=43179 RepID=UPI00038BD885|nr:beta-1,3-galactosyltransferase 4 [Ictidomys tridecemlineatus]XP_040138390.1 beta-1,3-galactosyltransferase 4 [Ictidomys tridecemlineatus]XP_040138391.1 beta-1,3-galactosyltransferase 4 [Ictidomys tridecemlineatus]KAG3289214.1 beta-1,3-galactosyltransferase 4 [Ictidomys tridecemlineatus]
MPLSLFRRFLLATLLLVIVWTLFGPSGVGEELLSLSLASLLPAPALPGPPLALPRLLIPNQEACSGPGAPPFLLILVCTAPENLNQRNAIRASWGGLREAQGLRVQTLFLLGEPNEQHPNSGAQKNDLARESAAQGDILQAAFQDSYRNLTLKTLSGLNWVNKHCPMARYVLKTDDDVYVNVPELVSELILRGGPGEQWERGVEPQRSAAAVNKEPESQALGSQAVPLLYLGRVHWRVKPSRTPGDRHRVSEEQWPLTWGPFPPYASGTGYVLSASAVQLILKVASRIPPLPLEDVFVGVSARRGGLAPTHCVKLAGATHYPLDRCCYGKFLLTSHKLDPWKMQEAWKLVSGLDGERTTPFCSWLQGVLGILRCRMMAWRHS